MEAKMATDLHMCLSLISSPGDRQNTADPTNDVTELQDISKIEQDGMATAGVAEKGESRQDGTATATLWPMALQSMNLQRRAGRKVGQDSMATDYCTLAWGLAQGRNNNGQHVMALSWPCKV